MIVIINIIIYIFWMIKLEIIVIVFFRFTLILTTFTFTLTFIVAVIRFNVHMINGQLVLLDDAHKIVGVVDDLVKVVTRHEVVEGVGVGARQGRERAESG